MKVNVLGVDGMCFHFHFLFGRYIIEANNVDLRVG